MSNVVIICVIIVFTHTTISIILRVIMATKMKIVDPCILVDIWYLLMLKIYNPMLSHVRPVFREKKWKPTEIVLVLEVMTVIKLMSMTTS